MHVRDLLHVHVEDGLAVGPLLSAWAQRCEVDAIQHCVNVEMEHAGRAFLHAVCGQLQHSIPAGNKGEAGHDETGGRGRT
jgi:hypothetical protein